MSDYIVRATAANETVRAFAIDSTEMTATAREKHGPADGCNGDDGLHDEGRR